MIRIEKKGYLDTQTAPPMLEIIVKAYKMSLSKLTTKYGNIYFNLRLIVIFYWVTIPINTNIFSRQIWISDTVEKKKKKGSKWTKQLRFKKESKNFF